MGDNNHDRSDLGVSLSTLVSYPMVTTPKEKDAVDDYTNFVRKYSEEWKKRGKAKKNNT